MPLESDLDHSSLLSQLIYNPITGFFTRANTKRRWKVGQRAGNKHKTLGYRRVRVDDILVWEHRLAWFYMTGKWPMKHIDHINGVRDDNRWCNLRQVSRAKNAQNLGGPRVDNQLGLLGVSRVRDGVGYRARIQLDGTQYPLGTFDTPELAHAAYLEAKAIIHTHNERMISNGKTHANSPASGK